jgi:hypothetical protein
MKKIVVEEIGDWRYFMWFLLGFYKNDEVKLIIHADWITRIASLVKGKYSSAVLRKLHAKVYKDNVNLKGYLINDNEQKINFIIDPLDSPYIYNMDDLESCDIYFKMQCPKSFNKEGFCLANNVYIPWSDWKSKNGIRLECGDEFWNFTHKIKPLMVGPRKLADGISFFQLNKGYNHCRKFKKTRKIKKIMCYFGNSKGPEIQKTDSQNLDVNCEGQIMGCFSELNHPNEKRAIVANILDNLTPKIKYDSRVIHIGCSDQKKEINSKVIPLSDFCKHISLFEYNVNICGYRKSIPNRFIESFMVDTAIITDELAIKWYCDFENEVYETVEMGYLPEIEVDWDFFKADLIELSKSRRQSLENCFIKKWSPEAVANYIVSSLLKS